MEPTAPPSPDRSPAPRAWRAESAEVSDEAAARDPAEHARQPVEGPLDWASALRRAVLRVALLALAFPVVTTLVFVTFSGLLRATGAPGDVPGTFGEWLLALLGAVLSGALAGLATLPLVPLAFVELAGAQRRSPRAHLVIAALLWPATLIAFVLMGLQVVYAISVFERGSLADAAAQMARAAESLLELRLVDWLRGAALCLPVPLTSFGRMRGWSPGKQRSLAIALTAIGTLVLWTLAEALSSSRGSGLRVVMGAAIASLVATLLPAAFLRADQAERKLASWLRRDD